MMYVVKLNDTNRNQQVPLGSHSPNICAWRLYYSSGIRGFEQSEQHCINSRNDEKKKMAHNEPLPRGVSAIRHETDNRIFQREVTVVSPQPPWVLWGQDWMEAMNDTRYPTASISTIGVEETLSLKIVFQRVRLKVY
jgi:hypothetical protein